MISQRVEDVPEDALFAFAARALEVPSVFDFDGRMELSTWNSREEFRKIKGRLWASSLAEAVVQLRGWITHAAAGKSAYYVVSMGGKIIRDSTGPNT